MLLRSHLTLYGKTKPRMLFGTKSDLKLIPENRKNVRKRLQEWGHFSRGLKSQVSPHGGARVGGPRAPHGATAVPKVHPETPKISKTIQNNLTKKESRRRRRLCTKKDQVRHPWNMKNRAGAHTGARFAHVAWHEKTYEKRCQSVIKDNARRLQNAQKKRG